LKGIRELEMARLANAIAPRINQSWGRLLQVGLPVERLSRKVSTKLGDSATNFVVRSPFSGFHFRPLQSSEVYMAMGIWEPYVCVCLSLGRGCVFIDVGAHIGYYSFRASRLVGAKGLVIAIEPDRRNFEVLAENMKATGFGNYMTYNKAVSTRSSTSFIESQIPLNSRICDDDTEDGNRVECLTIDSLEPMVERASLENGEPEVTVKIDVEGYEDEVVESGSSFFQRFRPRIIMEVYDFQDSMARRTLESLGYSHRALSPSYYLFEARPEQP
jgi:FkbM family methyltransferase